MSENSLKSHFLFAIYASIIRFEILEYVVRNFSKRNWYVRLRRSATASIPLRHLAYTKCRTFHHVCPQYLIWKLIWAPLLRETLKVHNTLFCNILYTLLLCVDTSKSKYVPRQKTMWHQTIDLPFKWCVPFN